MWPIASPPLGHRWDERLGQPGVVGDDLGRRMAADQRVLVVGLRRPCKLPSRSCKMHGLTTLTRTNETT
jgi:hypothetical protein